MKACPNGHPNDDKAKFCPYCEITPIKSIPPRKKYTFLGLVFLCAFLIVLAFYLLPSNDQNNLTVNKSKNNILLFKLAVSSALGLDLAPKLVQSYLETKYMANNISIQKKQSKNNLFPIVSIFGTVGKDSTLEVQVAYENDNISDFKPDLGMGLKRVVKNQISDTSMFEFPIGLEGIAVVVNKKNILDEIALCDLANIYAANYQKWSIFSAYNGDINPINIDSSSITRQHFKSAVLDNLKCPQIQSAKCISFKTESEILKQIDKDAQGVAYVSSANLDSSSKVLAIYEGGTRHLKPTVFNVSSGDYLILRQVFLFHPKTIENIECNNFIDFCLNDKGQKTIEAQKYAPLSITKDCNHILPPNAADDYKLLATKNCRLSVTIYFKTGKDEVEDDSKKIIERVVEFIKLPENKSKQIQICGFTDNVGRDASNNSLAKVRAEKLKQKLLPFCANIIVSNGFGSNSPVGDNSLDEGRQRNRRAEIWIGK